ELLKLMRAAGCAQIDYGFETGSQRVLTQIKGPGITLADHTRAIEVTRAAGIHVMGTFILGMPGESYAEMLDTRRFILDHLDQMHRFQVFCMTPYPGTALYALCVAKGLVDQDYCAEIAKEQQQGGEHMSRVYSDQVPAEQVLALKDELDLLSIGRVGLADKIRWLLFNLRHKPKTALEAIGWFMARRNQTRCEGSAPCR
ncbi:MAG: radical SAM protein, partial [Desulfobacterales bacterium]|nr:radical SAM protein [Desulfobacterales bacterium]